MFLPLTCLAAAQSFLSSLPPVSPHPEPAYRFWAEIAADVAPLVRERPGVIRPFVMGRSVEDRDIWAFEVRDPATTPTFQILVIAQIHALEWVPAEIAASFLVESVRYPHPDVALTVVPVFNVDGRARVEADLVEGRNLYRRGNANKVDLNRDFEIHRESDAVWRHIMPRRYTTSPSPLSQPESRALDQLAGSRPYDAAVSLHSYGGYIYYPWAGRRERAPDWRELHTLATAMAAAMGPQAYRPRQLSRWAFFFRGLGMEVDHLYGKYGIPSFLVETTHSGLSPLRPADWDVYFRWYNPIEPAKHIREGLRLLGGLVNAVGGLRG